MKEKKKYTYLASNQGSYWDWDIVKNLDRDLDKDCERDCNRDRDRDWERNLVSNWDRNMFFKKSDGDESILVSCLHIRTKIVGN